MKVIAVNGKVLLANGKAVKPPAVGSGFAETILTDAIANHFVSSSWSPSVTADKYIPKMYYYNGVLLPELPADVLASYPYAFIQKGTTHYNLVFSKVKYWYQSSDDTARNSDGTVKNYWLYFENLADRDTWAYRNDSWYYWESFSESAVWANYDIPNGSADATEIYFEGSEPVPAE